MNRQSTLIVRRENYRLWFEFYKICYVSNRTDIKLNLKSLGDFYKSWGDVTKIKFDDWWKSHEYLFEEPVIKVLDDISSRQTLDSLIIEIPFNQSTSSLLEKLKKLVEENQKLVKGKKTKKFTGSFQLTDNSEPKLKSIKDVLNIYCDVYIKNNRPKIPKLLPLVIEYYKGKKRMKLPNSLNEDENDLGNVLRNLGRWMEKGDKITLNVSKGIFPG